LTGASAAIATGAGHGFPHSIALAERAGNDETSAIVGPAAYITATNSRHFLT
jgi:hypothetical protein